MSTLSFLSPRAVAIIGASNDPTKRGFRAIESLQKARFAGAIYPVNRREREILGLRVYRDVQDLPEPVDLALVCTAAPTVPEIIEQCGRKRIAGAVVLALGFSESGSEGRALEQRLAAAARNANVRVVGPNTSGIFNTHCGLNLVGFSDLREGGIGIISQSGNMALALATEGHLNGHVGFSTYIGVGNEADLRFHDYLAHLGDDPGTSAIALYVEGFKDAIAFLDTASAVSRHKPVVLYKGGRTAIGRSAVRSHTGSLAGDYAVAKACLRQSGVTVVERSDALLHVAEGLSLMPPLRSRRVAVLADGGGHATIAADALHQAGLDLPPLGDATRARLAAILSPLASIANPIDIANSGDRGPDIIAEAADVLLSDAHVDGLLVVGMFGGFAIRFSATLADQEAAAGARFAQLPRKHGKPVIVHSIFAPAKPEALVRVREGGIPLHDSIEMAALVFGALAERCADLGRVAPAAAPASRSIAVPDRAAATIAHARSQARNALTEPEALDLLHAHGIAVPPHALARNEADLAAVAQSFGDAPLALKIVSPQILHKSDLGGVVLDVRGAAPMQRAFASIMQSARRSIPNADLEGVLITPMAPPGVELIVGMKRDPQYGPVMMFGTGGIYVEVLSDVTFRRLPVGEDDALQLIARIKAEPLLDGVRGRAAVDRRALAALMAKLSTLCLAHPEIAEVDLNPVIASAQGCTIADARILLA